MSRLAHQPSDPAYYIKDWLILCGDYLTHIWRVSSMVFKKVIGRLILLQCKNLKFIYDHKRIKKCISLYLITNSATHMVKLKISQVKWFPDLSALIENSDHFHPPTVYPFCSCYDQSHQMWNFTWKTSSFVSVIDRKGSEE